MAAAVLIYLAFNAGRGSAHGWGVAMSTDTAFALGMLALIGPRFPDRLRAFVLTVVVVDDLVALVVIATVYTQSVAVVPLLVAVGLFAVVLVARSLGVRPGLVYVVLGVAALGRALQVGRRSGGGRPRAGPARLRLSRGALGPGARERALSAVPRAADARARARRAHGASSRRSRPTNAWRSAFTPGRAT